MMKHGQNNRRQRSRGNGRKHSNQRGGSYDSNGPETKVRGNAAQVLEKYQALARDANSAGDRILAEGYLQHAEHYYRILNAENENSKREDNNRGRQDRDNRSQNNADGSNDENQNEAQQESAGEQGRENAPREKNVRRRSPRKDNNVEAIAAPASENSEETAKSEAPVSEAPVDAIDASSKEDVVEKKPRTRRPRKPQATTVNDDTPEAPQAAD